jgi:predicted nuclease of restriction endonuclease-like (RecB) superfamily
MENSTDYIAFVGELKTQILRSRYNAARLINREMLLLYFAIGKRLSEKIAAEKWGAKVIQQISEDLQKAMPGLRGFSNRNLKNMRQFADEYASFLIGQLSTAQLEVSENQLVKIRQSSSGQFDELNLEIFLSLGFTHHVMLMNRCKDMIERRFYMGNAVTQQWTVEILDHQIDAKLYQKQGTLPNNFASALPEHLRDKALLAFKDEHLLDFVHIDPDDERVLEKHIVDNIRRFILTMGNGFSFIGNQYRLVVDEDEFFIDLLFFNRVLQCLVPVELKRGKFRPEHLGKLNFYLNVLNDTVRLPHENPSIGIVLCREKKDALVQYAVQGMTNPMGVATYRVSNEMPDALRRVLPDVEGLQRLLDEE